ncbi:MAG: hypothetical protein RL885_07285 [Planctomycetota bacterium]
MTVSIWLLAGIGVLGAIDIVAYHTLAHAIRRHPECRREVLIHAARGPGFMILFGLLPNLAWEGAWFWALIAVLAAELPISLVDFLIEKRSRSHLGGLPTGEYILHSAIAVLYGALIACVFFEGAHWASSPTGLRWEPAAVPLALRVLLGLMAAGALVACAQDLLAARRLDRAAVSERCS